MAIEVSWTGVSVLNRALSRRKKRIRRESRAALRTVGRKIRKDARAEAPQRARSADTKRQLRHRRRYMTKKGKRSSRTLRQSFVIKVSVKRRSSSLSIIADKYYARFLEKGTKLRRQKKGRRLGRIGGKTFLANAVSRHERELIKLLGQTLRVR